MSYSRKVYVKAASTLERRRSKAEHTQSMHREEAYAKIPELISIDREISSAGAEVIREEKSCRPAAPQGYPQGKRLSRELS